MTDSSYRCHYTIEMGRQTQYQEIVKGGSSWLTLCPFTHIDMCNPGIQTVGATALPCPHEHRLYGLTATNFPT
jgi:hypothetical protein